MYFRMGTISLQILTKGCEWWEEGDTEASKHLCCDAPPRPLLPCHCPLVRDEAKGLHTQILHAETLIHSMLFPIQIRLLVPSPPLLLQACLMQAVLEVSLQVHTQGKPKHCHHLCCTCGKAK